MKERIFIKHAIEQSRLEEFLRKFFKLAKHGDIEIQHTPVGIRIIIYTVTPGTIIGAGGEKIKEAIKLIEKEFGFENPQIDVQKIDNPFLDPKIVSQNIAEAIEKGINYKQIGSYYISKIMQAGAIGCEIVLSGKFAGARGRRERFVAGYLKKCGEPAEKDVLKAFAVAYPKLGSVGITVKIMVNPPQDTAKALRASIKDEKETENQNEEQKEKIKESEKSEDGKTQDKEIEKSEKKGEVNGNTEEKGNP